MNLKKDLEFLRDIKKAHGVREAIKYLYSGLRYKGRTRLILVALENPKPIAKAVNAAQSHHFRFATTEDLKKMMQFPEYEIADVDLYRVENDIAKCLLHIDGKTVTGYAWVWTSNLAYIDNGFYLNLPEDAIYNYKALTLPEYRGFGFQGLRHLKILELLRNEGKARLFGFVNHLNYKSLHGVRKSGYRPVGDLIFKTTKEVTSASLRLTNNFWAGKPVALDRDRL